MKRPPRRAAGARGVEALWAWCCRATSVVRLIGRGHLACQNLDEGGTRITRLEVGACEHVLERVDEVGLGDRAVIELDDDGCIHAEVVIPYSPDMTQTFGRRVVVGVPTLDWLQRLQVLGQTPACVGVRPVDNAARRLQDTPSHSEEALKTHLTAAKPNA